MGFEKMKLGEAIKNKDYSLFKKGTQSFYNYYDTLSDILYSDGSSIGHEWYDAVENSNRVECYAVREWLCTDTHVGLYLYLVDGEAVCLMHQSGRKSYPEWNFLSEKALQKTRDLFDDHKPKKEVTFDGFNADFLELYLDETLFECDITDEQIGLSPLLKYGRYVDFLSGVNIKKENGLYDGIKEAMQHHDKLFDQLKKENNQFYIDRFLKDSQEIYDKVMELLK